MFRFGEKHPVLFEVILIVFAFFASAVLTAAGSLFDLHPELSSSIGRIVVSAALFIIFKRAFGDGKPSSNCRFVIPALLFAAWNLFYNLSSGMVIGGAGYLAEAVITAAAPAVFEEVLFRGIFLYNLRKKHDSDLRCLFLSAAVFSAVHLTNLVGLDLISVALQLVSSLVIGLVLAAVYLKNNSLPQVIFAHFLIDFTNRIFVEQASSASALHLILFALLLAAEAVFAIRLTAFEAAAAGPGFRNTLQGEAPDDGEQ